MMSNITRIYTFDSLCKSEVNNISKFDIFCVKKLCPSVWWAGPGGQVKFGELFGTLFLGTLAPWNLGTLVPWLLDTLTLCVGSVFGQMPNLGEFWLIMKDFTGMKIVIYIVITIKDIFKI